MKKHKLLPMILVIILATPLAMQGAQISFYIGKVKLYRNGRVMSPSMGKILRAGDLLITGRRSKVDIKYEDGSRISVKSYSKVRFGSKSIQDSRHIAIISGILTGKFNKLSKNKKSHKIVTPTIVCAVRGTEFKVIVSKSGKSRVDLSEGKLKLSNPAGSDFLNANQQMKDDISKPPRIGPISSKTSAWQNKENKRLKTNPWQISKGYKAYMNQFSSRSNSQSKEVKTHKKKIKSAKTIENLDWVEKKINNSEDKIENDLLLNETTITSIPDIIEDYKKRKNRIYRIFYRIKRDCNKVKEQQERNYRELQAVRRAHKEAKTKIKDKYEADKKRINNIDMKKFKPSFDLK
jgi:hypothetical protein